MLFTPYPGKVTGRDQQIGCKGTASELPTAGAIAVLKDPEITGNGICHLFTQAATGYMRVGHDRFLKS